MSQPVIRIRNLGFMYHNIPVLEHIEFDVFAKEFIGVVGPNAGGKSTLLHIILGLLSPMGGSVQVLSKPAGEMSHQLGYVPQHPTFERDFPINVLQLVLLGLPNQRTGLASILPKRYSQADKQAAMQALAEVGAEALHNRQISGLSGGQLQRILIARALISQPQILLLDEPTSNIDMRHEGEIFDLLKQLNSRMTILVVSHDVAFVSAYVTRVACVNRTLVCHQTDSIDGNLIHDLYGDDVRMVAHSH